MQDYKIEVGDRVTYRSYGTDENIITLVSNDTVMDYLKNILSGEVLYKIEILKIERIGSNGWYTVYEKDKELLTEKEKEFFTDILKYYEVKYIFFQDEDMSLSDKDYHMLACIDYPKTLNFQNLKGKNYSLSELRLEE